MKQKHLPGQYDSEGTHGEKMVERRHTRVKRVKAQNFES
jgi:hypothetical protein